MIMNGKIEDAEKVAKIKIDTWRKTYKNIFPDEYLAKLNLENEIEKYKSNFKNRKIITFVKDEEIIAYCYYGEKKEKNLNSYTGEIFAIYVKSECQERGVGTVLLQEAIKDLSKIHKKIMVWCAKENYRAISFYKRNGLKTIGEEIENIGGKDVEKVALGINLEEEKTYNLKKSANYIENEENIALYTNPDLIFLKNETRDWFKQIINHKEISKIPQKFIDYLIKKDAIEQI